MISSSEEKIHSIKDSDNAYHDPAVPRLRLKDIEVLYHRSVEEMITSLDSLDTQDIFYGKNFFRTIEKYPPSQTIFRYLELYKGNKLLGFLHLQIRKIDLGESLDAAFDADSAKSLFYKLSFKIKKFVTRRLSNYTLVCGNMLQTGNYGIYFEPDADVTLNIETLHEMLEFACSELRKEKIGIVAILLKDYYQEEKYNEEKTLSLGYHEFSVQPNMLLDIHKDWKSMDDYLASLKSKYKVRTRRTFKKMDGIEKRELSISDLEFHKDRMHEMYKYIATQASFNLFILEPNYFLSLKENLGDNCKIIGYFLQDKMVGFFTIIFNEHVLDAHFLGYDPECNRQCHLYHNMLYDLLKEGIDSGADHLDLSRTAMEIKSSIGAVPKDMFLYLRIRNRFFNFFTKWVLPYLIPNREWEQRKPFKN